MKTFIPPRPGPGSDGDSSELRFYQAVWDVIWGGKFPFVSTDTVRWSTGQQGYWAEAARRSGGKAAEAVITQCFHIKSINNDYLTCRTWDGSNEGGEDVYVAKDIYFRLSYTSIVIDSTTYTFTSYTNNQRTSTSGAVSQVEVVYPRYDVYSTPSAGVTPVGTIWAQTSNYTGVTVSDEPVTWIEVAPSRVWIKKYA